MNISQVVFQKYTPLIYRVFVFVLLINGLNIITFGQTVNEILEYSTTVCQKGNYRFNVNNSKSVVFPEDYESCVPKENGIPNYDLISWTISHPGMLTFLIEAGNSFDDFDFELFIIKNDELRLVRCMASGPQLGKSKEYSDPCLGLTGLGYEIHQVYEDKGCNPSKTNFVAPIFVSKGEQFVLRVFNFSSNNGYNFTIDGSAELAEEYTAIEIIAEPVPQSKKWQMYLANSGDELFEGISWDFGEDAYPPVAKGVTQAEVSYLTSGDKVVSLILNSNSCHFQKKKIIAVGEKDVTSHMAPSLVASPNPFKTETNLKLLKSTPEKEAEIHVYSADGFLIYHAIVSIVDFESIVQLKGSSWPSGRYTAVLSYGDVELKSSIIKI